MRLLLVTVAISACVLSAAETGEAMFSRHCAPCHGLNGEGGRGPALAVRQLPRAPDDAVLAAIIHDGIPGTGMPGTRMTAEQYVALVAWVRGLGRRPAPALVRGPRERRADLPAPRVANNATPQVGAAAAQGRTLTLDRRAAQSSAPCAGNRHSRSGNRGAGQLRGLSPDDLHAR